MRCSAIKSGGERCRLDATHGSYCWSHAPETASERALRARRGGKAGGNGRPGSSELIEAKQGIRKVIADVLEGDVDKGKAAVALQGYNVLLRALGLEREIKETEELAAEISALKEEVNRREHGATA